MMSLVCWIREAPNPDGTVCTSGVDWGSGVRLRRIHQVGRYEVWAQSGGKYWADRMLGYTYQEPHVTVWERGPHPLRHTRDGWYWAECVFDQETSRHTWRGVRRAAIALADARAAAEAQEAV